MTQNRWTARAPVCLAVAFRSARRIGLCLGLSVGLVAGVTQVAFADPATDPSTLTSTTAEQVWLDASELINAQRYREALATLRQLQKRFPEYSNMSAVQTRIAVLHESREAGASLPLFLQALDLRDEGRLEEALVQLGRLRHEHDESPLLDDALYLSAYLQVMDRYDFAAARAALVALRERYPDSAYQDSADYLDAIAMEQLGDTEGASIALRQLRERHTALTLPLGFRWPAGNMLSRYWFDRTDRRLAIVEQRLAAASTIKKRQDEADGQLRLAVSVEGIDMTLVLTPSPLTRSTAWRDASLRDRLPPALGVYDGVVEGIDGSWVRAVLKQDTINGVVHANGVQHRLHSADLIGTLNYYQPRQGREHLDEKAHSELSDSLQGLDVLIAPPQQAILQGRSRSIQTDVRAVPISIVIDSKFDRYYAGDGMATALNQLNVADGVYRQFGLALTLDEALTFSENSDPIALAPTTLESILRSFRDFRLQRKTLFDGSALTYLFTGNTKTDITLGLAWIDTICRSDGYDVGVTTPSAFGDVLLTHEIGHSLGALHDSDTECRDDSSNLMWPNISARTNTGLSQCSTNSIVASRSRGCLVNTVDLSLAARGDGESVRFLVSNADTALTLDAVLDVESSWPEQIDWPTNCQPQSPTSAQCRISDLGPGEQRELSLPLSVNARSAGPVTATLRPLVLLELNPTDNTATATADGSQSTTPDEIDTAESPPPRDDVAMGGGASSGLKRSSAGGTSACFMIALSLLLCFRRVRFRC